MKTKLPVYLTIVLLPLGCNIDEDQTLSKEGEVAEVRNIISGTQWRVSSFIDSGDDETRDFSGFIFEFDTNDILTTTNGSENYPGTWTISDNDQGKDGTNIDKYGFGFFLNFTNPPQFEELTEDWEIVSLSDSRIELRHAGTTGLDLLTFEKL